MTKTSFSIIWKNKVIGYQGAIFNGVIVTNVKIAFIVVANFKNGIALILQFVVVIDKWREKTVKSLCFNEVYCTK